MKQSRVSSPVKEAVSLENFRRQVWVRYVAGGKPATASWGRSSWSRCNHSARISRIWSHDSQTYAVSTSGRYIRFYRSMNAF